MKILIVRMWADELNINSYNCQEIGLAKALIRKGNICDIVLYTKNKSSYEQDIIFDGDKKIHIYYLRAKTFLKNALYEKKLYDIIEKYDVIQTAEYDQIGNVKLMKKAKGKIVIYHGPYKSKYTKGYKKKCIISDVYYLLHPKYKKVKIISKSPLATEFLKKKGFKNVETVGVGIDLERFNQKDIFNKEITQLIENKKANNLEYLLYIGKIEDRRNILFLIDILKKLSEERKNIRLIVVGRGNKDYKAKCIEYAKKQNVLDKIIYFEAFEQKELSELYKISDIFLLPTKYEIFGMVLLEAMYFGIPIITTKNGGSTTVIKDGKNGFIRENDNHKQWLDIINKVLENKVMAQNIKDKSQETIKNNYTWDKLVEKIIKIYNEEGLKNG